MLGFGGRGHDMLKSFQVKYLGEDKVDGVDTAKLELVPEAASVRNNIDHIILWIDPTRGISVQQQFFLAPPATTVSPNTPTLRSMRRFLTPFSS